MRRENGRHSCVTGTKLHGNMTIKNLTTDRASASRLIRNTKSRLPRKAGGTVTWEYESASQMHSQLNDQSASSNSEFPFERCGRQVRAKMVKALHRRERRQLKGEARAAQSDA